MAAKNAMDVLKANPVTGSGLRQLGTAVLVNIVNNIGAFPTKNWQESYYDKGDDISGETLAEKYLVKPGAASLPHRLRPRGQCQWQGRRRS